MSRQDRLALPASSTETVEPTDEDVELHINLRLRLDKVVAVEAERLRTSARRPPTTRQLIQLAYRIYEARRLRDRLLDESMFGEPAWDMLLALYCLPPRGQMLSVTGLSYAANVALTTGLRWQRLLTTEGLIERGPEGVDKRLQALRLTPHGKELLERYLTRLFHCDQHSRN